MTALKQWHHYGLSYPPHHQRGTALAVLECNLVGRWQRQGRTPPVPFDEPFHDLTSPRQHRKRIGTGSMMEPQWQEFRGYDAVVCVLRFLARAHEDLGP